jgi:hypothetical protein
MERISMVLRLVFAIAVLFTPAFGQEKPSESDSQSYKDAYELLFDSQARAKKAEQLLLDGNKKELGTLSEKELSLLCRTYNELGIPERQLVVSTELWERFPTSPDATRWMVNSLLNTMFKEKDVAKTINFVDSALKENKGLRSELLVLKARATMGKNAKISDAKRRVEIADLLIEAYACNEKSDSKFDFPDLTDVSFVDMDPIFAAYFSSVEREALKVRMQKARDSRK